MSLPDVAANEGQSSASSGGFSLFAYLVALSLYCQDSPLGIVSSVTGVAYTVFNGKGKRCAYLLGLVNSALYAFIAFNAQIYGDAALYLLYYFPAMVVGFIVWDRHLDAQNFEVVKRLMSVRGRAGIAVVCAVGTVVLGFVLRAMGDAAPFLDSFTTVVSAAALLVALGRYVEQWPLWTAVNAAEVALWAVRLAQGGAAEAGGSLVMWAVFLFIGIYMWARQLLHA